MGNTIKATIIVAGMLAVGVANAYFEMSFVVSYLIGIAYGSVAVPVYLVWAD